MPHRTNLVLTDQAWDLLQRVPRGKRSGLVSRAVVTELTLQQRREAADRMDARAQRMQPLPGSAEQWIREDRDSH